MSFIKGSDNSILSTLSLTGICECVYITTVLFSSLQNLPMLVTQKESDFLLVFMSSAN